jgi:hypothetical protein
MSCSMEAFKRNESPEPIRLYEQTQIFNQSLKHIHAIVAVYSLHGKDFADAVFCPDNIGIFTITRISYPFPEDIDISLFAFHFFLRRGERAFKIIDKRTYSLVEFFSKEHHFYTQTEYKSNFLG